MKKRMINLVLALVAMLPLQAQSLDGKWMALDDEDGTAMAYILVFEGDLMRQALVSSTDAENLGQMTVAIAVPAQNFTPGAKKLNFTFDAKQVELAIQDIDFNDELKADFKKNPKKEEQTRKFIEKHFESLKEEMANTMLLSGEHTIVKQTDDELVLKDTDGETYQFVKNK